MFQTKREREVVSNYKKHAEIALQSMDLFTKQVAALLQFKWDEIAKLEKEIYKKEREGDELRRRNEYLFSEGILFPTDRETFIRLSEEIDKVIDKIQQVSRIVTLRRPSIKAIEFLKNSDVMKYLDVTKKSIVVLYKSAMELLDGDPHKAVKLAHDVEKYESMADELKLSILRRLYGEEKNISDILSILQIEKMILWIDAISDKAEDASDIIILITAKILP